MSTPRKHWFRVADSVAHEPWSNDVTATFVRLLAHLNTRWAREGRSPSEAGSVVLSRGTTLMLAGCGQLARARSILHELATHVSLVIDEQGTSTAISWPNFAKFQRLGSEPGAPQEPDAPEVVPSPQDARRKTQDAPKIQESEPPSADGAKGSRARTAQPPPEWAREIAERLAYLVRQRAPGAQVSRDPTPWAKEIARIGDDPGRIATAVEWLYGPNESSECSFVVQSGRALREKYGRITAAMSRNNGVSHAPRGKPGGIIEATNRILAEIDERERQQRGEGARGPDLASMRVVSERQ